MYHVKTGPANQSYGIQVARLAGLPNQVLSTAQKKLAGLESVNQSQPQASFNFNQETCQNDLLPQQQSKVDEKIIETNPDDLNPRQALDLIYQLKALLD